MAAQRRHIHLIDIENFLDLKTAQPADITRFATTYRLATNTPNDAHIIIATSHPHGAACVKLGWPQARVLYQHGPDGADNALLDIITTENLTARYTHITIASGDHAFAEAATTLTEHADVTIIGRRGHTAKTLTTTGATLTYFTAPGATGATTGTPNPATMPRRSPARR